MINISQTESLNILGFTYVLHKGFMTSWYKNDKLGYFVVLLNGTGKIRLL